MTSSFETYLSKIENDLRGGKATEHTYRGSFEIFIESLDRNIEASSEPKHIECGAPDVIVEKRKVPLGYIETKDVGVDLNKIEKTDQMKRYLKALNNLILTDYVEFRWYVNGERKRKIRIADVGKNNRLTIHENAENNLTQLFQDFFIAETPTVHNPKELALRLSGVTHFIREQIVAVLKSGDAKLQNAFQKRFSAFRDLLLPALKEEEFADLYAQTMTYGLFAAKLSAPENAEFTLQSAYQYLFGNKFLRRLFSDVSEELDEIEIIRPYLLDIISLLNHADFTSILTEFGKRTRTEDPVVHFYETFLAAYDPKLRESRGVYYTPEPVVQFIVNSVDTLLKDRFKLTWGLADSAVKVLDPATGTGTFLYYVIQKIQEEVVTNRKQAGIWKQKSKELLNRIFGFELLIAPYVVSHLKLGLLLKTLGAPLEKQSERLQIYLTNTLEEGFLKTERSTGTGFYLAEEGIEAAEIKKMQDIMVVLGNPPYSNFGMMNKGKWIENLLEDYKKDLDEKKINLDDDYIKFIRFGQWRIENSGEGVLAFITNHSFIDGITHRRMRESLRETFSEIYVLDLHGSTQKEETPPNGINDQNVFDIKQGVSICIFIRRKEKTMPATVYHAELWGNRESKYDFLASNNVESIKWEELKNIDLDSCLGKFYFFTPKAFDNINEYCDYWSIEDIFRVNQNGIKTDRDGLFFDFDKRTLNNRIKKFYSRDGIESPFKEEFKVENSSSYDILKKREKTKFDESNLHQCLYRPFDPIWFYYSHALTSRPAWNVMQHMIKKDNLALLSCRQQAETGFHHIFCSNLLTECCAVSLKTKEITSVFPLYTYDSSKNDKYVGEMFATRQANLSPAFIKAVEEKLKVTFVNQTSEVLKTSEVSAEDIFYYAYAVFHSPTYRTRYAEFLKIDFPRLPITSDIKLFRKLAEKGKELVALHLLKSSKVDDFITTYPESGNNKAEKVNFAKGKVFINETQYFGNVPEEVWNFKVGGYQVCEKWLKDRKGRELSGDEITHYQRVVVSLKETMRLMKEIDKAIPKFPIE